MDLRTWNVREYKLESGEDVAFLLYRPITHGLRTRHLELSLRLQGAVSLLSDAQDGEEGGAPSEEQIAAVLSSQGEASKLMGGFRAELLSALLVGCRDLTIEEKVPSREELLEVVLSMEDLASSLCSHILEEGSISEDEGKD